MAKRKANPAPAMPSSTKKRRGARRPLDLRRQDATTVAAIELNRRKSSLMKLSPELRHKIFGLVLGNQLIHINHDTETKALSHNICLSSDSEFAEYERSKTDTSVEPTDTEYRSSSHRHRACHSEETPVTGRKMSLALLRVCRQTYEEGTHILLTTNTFSFNHPSKFNAFMANLNSAQKHSLKHLHLDLAWDFSYYPRPQNLRVYQYREVTQLFELANASMLDGVKTLHLELQCECVVYEKCEFWESAWTQDSLPINANYMWAGGVRWLQALSLKNVTVVVNDVEVEAEDYLDIDIPISRWPVTDRRAFAEDLKRMLLNPRGTEVLEIENKIDEYQKEIKKTFYDVRYLKLRNDAGAGARSRRNVDTAADLAAGRGRLRALKAAEADAQARLSPLRVELDFFTYEFIGGRTV